MVSSSFRGYSCVRYTSAFIFHLQAGADLFTVLSTSDAKTHFSPRCPAKPGGKAAKCHLCGGREGMSYPLTCPPAGKYLQRMARGPFGCGVQFLRSFSAKENCRGRGQEFIAELL